jgi:hypothetical protein
MPWEHREVSLTNLLCKPRPTSGPRPWRHNPGIPEVSLHVHPPSPGPNSFDSPSSTDLHVVLQLSLLSHSSTASVSSSFSLEISVIALTDLAGVSNTISLSSFTMESRASDDLGGKTEHGLILQGGSKLFPGPLGDPAEKVILHQRNNIALKAMSGICRPLTSAWLYEVGRTVF